MFGLFPGSGLWNFRIERDLSHLKKWFPNAGIWGSAKLEVSESAGENMKYRSMDPINKNVDSVGLRGGSRNCKSY